MISSSCTLLSETEDDDIMEEPQEPELPIVADSPFEEQVGNNWKPSDATLPKGWMVNDCMDSNDEVNMIYRSPCKKEFTSRDDITKFLVSQGRKIIKTAGFKNLDTEKNKCDGFCEGSCRGLTVPESFYHPNDRNKSRKQTKLAFVGDDESTIGNMKDKLIKGVPKIKQLKQLKYYEAEYGRIRPVIIFIDEPIVQEKAVIEKGNKKTPEQLRNEIWKVTPNLKKSKADNSDLKNHLPQKMEDTPITEQMSKTSEDVETKENSPTKSKKSKTRLRATLKIVDDNSPKEESEIRYLLETENNDDLQTNRKLSVTSEEKEKSIVEICTLSDSKPKSGFSVDTQEEVKPKDEKQERNMKSKNTKRDMNIKTYMQELKDVESKRRSLLTVNILETEKSKLPSKEDQTETEEVKKMPTIEIITKKRQSLPAKLLTPLAHKRKSIKACTPKEKNTPSLIDFDLVYKKDKTPSSSSKHSLGEKRKSLLDVFQVRSSKKQKKNESLSDEEIKRKNIAKLKKLQQKEVAVNKKEGTYVQCGNEKCLIWRLLKEYHDPSNVPDDWVCLMNSDPESNVCGEGR